MFALQRRSAILAKHCRLVCESELAISGLQSPGDADTDYISLASTPKHREQRVPCQLLAYKVMFAKLAQ